MDFAAEGMTDLSFESLVNLDGRFHGFLGLFLVRKTLPAHERSDGHNRSHKGTACFPVPGHTSGEGAARLEYVLTHHANLFLQSCKNGLRSAVIIHFVVEGCFIDFLKKFLAVFVLHRSFPSSHLF